MILLPRSVKLWEKGTEPATNAGIRTVFMRLGIGLTPRGGALQRILATSPFGFIRRFGSGRQYISWISRDDMVARNAPRPQLSRTLHGPVNIVAPQPVTNAAIHADHWHELPVVHSFFPSRPGFCR